MRRAIFRFRRDMRVDDHAGLHAAAAHGEIVPVIVIDESENARLQRSPRRAAFFRAAVRALHDALRPHGSRCIVRRGQTAAVLQQLAQEYDAGAVFWGTPYAADELAADAELQSELEERGLIAQGLHDAAAIGPEESAAAKTSAGAGYRAFAPYLEVWHTLAAQRYANAQHFARVDEQPDPLADFGDAIAVQRAPETAQRAFERYLERDIFAYPGSVDVPADARTSRLSAHLSFGTLSARSVVRAVRKRAEDPFLLAEERVALERFLASIAMRDFFLQLAWHNPESSRQPLQEKMRSFAFQESHPHFAAWCEGTTGFPLVDAGMRELRATGWMHPRARKVAASFLCFDLGLDWRSGLRVWDDLLIEDDPALAAGNWQWIAGVGADLAAYPRIYNPLKQGRRFDPDAEYVRTWIPDLAGTPAVSIWNAGDPRAQLHLPLFTRSYPVPVVDHERVAREFLRRYVEFTTPASADRANR